MPSARELGLYPGRLAPGPGNAISDVAGVTVGHYTLADTAAGLATGVTAVLPHQQNLFQHKVRAGVEVINGFGKSVGLVQVAELGTVETPILLSNTFAIAPCVQALTQRAIVANPDIGRATSTVNPLIFECNDGAINDIQAMAVTTDHAEAAIANATAGAVAQGAVGAGTGMTAFGFKGGIGSASRLMTIEECDYVLGALVLANFGSAGDLVLPDGRRPNPAQPAEAEKGSVIVILATDLPLGDRQLRRVAQRAGAGLARLGSFWGNGSGDIALCFTTADPVTHEPQTAIQAIHQLTEEQIDLPFRAAAEATQEAVLNALCAAPAMAGRDGRHFPSLADWLQHHESIPQR